MSTTALQPLGAAQHLQAVAAEVAHLAANLVREVAGDARAMRTKSSPTDVVTSTDLQSERLIRDELTARCPGSTIIGEEFDESTGSNSVGWIVDPIDGTVNFLYTIPIVSVSIAATVGGETVAGAVVDVMNRETFSAARGYGAQHDATVLGELPVAPLAASLVATGFSYDAQRRHEQSAILNRLLPSCRDIRCMGSAALNLCWVAAGRIDAYYEHDTKPYDYAAGALIASESGATVELPHDNELGLTLAARDATFGALRSLVVDC